MGQKLYVGNLPYTTTQEDLEVMFNEVAPTKSVQLVTDKYSGKSNGFAFIEMVDDEGAAKAISELNDKEVGERKMVVNEARPRTEGGNRGGNGGGNGGGGYSNNRSGGGGYSGGRDRR